MNDSIHIRPLEKANLEEILEVYNQSFADYIIPVSLTPEHLNMKLNSESVDLKLSVGAFDGERLIGFIFYGIRDNKAYIGGTGVLPNYRGRKITYNMLHYSFEILKSNAIESILLEVITENKFAINAYQEAGFSITRKVNCYEGFPIIIANPLAKIEPLTDLELISGSTFWDIHPTWQNNLKSVQNIKEVCIMDGIYEKGELVAYKIMNKKLSRIYQFAVHKEYRNRYYASILFSNLKDQKVRITNVDENELSTNDFLRSLGLKCYIQQFEMKKTLI